MSREALGRLVAAAVWICLLGAATPAPASTCGPGGCGCPPPVAVAAKPQGLELTVTYYGVSTLMFSNGRDRLLIDGFFSRPKTRRLLLTRISPNPDRVQEGLGKGNPPVRAILTAHAHHDHALDTAAVAGFETDAIVVGTPSVAKLAQDQGVVASRVCVPIEGEPMLLGPFVVTAFYVPHGPNPFYLRWLLDHPLRRTLKGPAWFGCYKDDKNLSYLIEYGGRRILVHPSSGQPTKTVEAETVFLGLGRVGKMSEVGARGYWWNTVNQQTKTVVPIHWDRFTTRLGKPLVESPEPLDNFQRSRKRVCGYAKEKPGAVVLRMESLAVLRFPLGEPAQGQAGVTAFCDESG